MTDLRQAIQKHVSDAWNMAGPDPSGVDSLTTTWSHLQPASQAHLAGVAHRVIQGLLDDGCLQQPTHDDEGKAVQAVNTLHGLTGDINETTAWIKRAARLAAAGVDGDTLDVLGRISATHPVTPDDLNKLAAGSIPTPSLDQPDEWEECEASEVSVSDQCIRIQTRAGYEVKGKPTQVTDMGIQINDSYTIFWYDAKSIYRIPAPVVHPDPEEHPVVISNTGVAWVWDGDKYIEVLGGGHRGPGDFGPGWTPGKVIADE